MFQAYELDRRENEKGKPAIKKLVMANEVYASLRKAAV